MSAVTRSWVRVASVLKPRRIGCTYTALRLVFSAGLRVAKKSDWATRVLPNVKEYAPPPHRTFCARPALAVAVSVVSTSPPAVWLRLNAVESR